MQSDFIYTSTLSKADINARYGGNLGLNVSASDYLTLSGGVSSVNSRYARRTDCKQL